MKLFSENYGTVFYNISYPPSSEETEVLTVFDMTHEVTPRTTQNGYAPVPMY